MVGFLVKYGALASISVLRKTKGFLSLHVRSCRVALGVLADKTLHRRAGRPTRQAVVGDVDQAARLQVLVDKPNDVLPVFGG
jgi:hypothetical protein